ncbi:MAG: CPBP family glutamic-type intramembrane protease [Promethearchaeota archaeon]|jgi:membrane protease YdiL (CAAX protease family)
MKISLEPESTDLLYFFILSFFFTWALWFPKLLSSIGLIPFLPFFNILMILGSFGPLVSSFFFTYKDRGLDGVKHLWHMTWHCDKKVYLIISLTLIPGLTFFSLLLASLLEGFNLNDFIIQDRLGFLAAEILVTFFIGGPFQEELGWRGYALDQLQDRWNALESSIILGGIWSLWHFPLFYIEGTPHINQSFINFTVSIIIISILFTWLHNNTNGSVLAAMSFHASLNVSSLVFLPKISIVSNQIFTLFLDLTVVIVLVAYGHKTLKRNKKKDEIVNTYKSLETLT